MKRLDDLEKKAAARQNGKVTVKFVDGKERKMLLSDVIPLLLADESQIVGITGDGGQRCGQLAALIRGLLEPPEMEVEL